LVCPQGKEEEAITRLSRVGFDKTIGFLQGGIAAWKSSGKETDSLTSISAEEFKKVIETLDIPVFDVRKEREYASSHIQKAKLTPLDFLNDYLTEFPSNKDFYLHCAGGYRSIIAASILKSRGIHNLIDVAGGFADIKKVGIPVTNEVCP